MKYIKTYETATLEDRLKYDDVRDSFYWQVNTKQPYFSVALKKIGMPITIISVLLKKRHL